MQIEKHLAEQLRAHAEATYPHEAVGILAGHRKDNLVLQTVPLQNEHQQAHNRYQVNPLAQWQAEAELEAQGLEVLGYYHSHPDHPSQYSETDRQLALPNVNYVIIAVEFGKSHSIQNWRLLEDRSAMEEQPFIETNSPSKETT